MRTKNKRWERHWADVGKRIKRIKELKKKFPSWTWFDYARAMGLTYREVRYAFEQADLKHNPFYETEMMDRLIIKIINSEVPNDPYTDQEIADLIFKLHKILYSYKTVNNRRYALEIPKARERQKIYFLQGREKWKYPKEKRNPFLPHESK